MPLDSLDEDLLFDHSNDGEIGKMNRQKWLEECNQLERKFNIGLLITIVISLIIFILLLNSVGTQGLLVVCFVSILSIYNYIANKKKFDKLKSLYNHQFLLKENAIVEIVDSEKRIFKINQLKDIQKFNWGIELEDKSRKYNDRKMMIPKQISNFEDIKTALKIKK